LSETVALFTEMRVKRREWTRTIEQTKASHWREFLDNASSGKLWKAATHMGPRKNYANIPPLKVGETEVADNQDKARVLMESFFPKMADPIQETPTTPKEEIPWEPVTESEIERALKAMKGKTAPGEDGLSTLV
jgi:hypothetical protein